MIRSVVLSFNQRLEGEEREAEEMGPG